MNKYDIYGKTFNRFVNYKKLSVFLDEKSCFNDKEIMFVDLPCGSGDLLYEIQSLEKDTPILGVDNDLSQVNRAKDKIRNNFNIIKSDCFELNMNEYLCQKVIVHCGNSFIQIFKKQKQKELIEHLLKLKNISKIYMEYQNIEYFDYFRENVYYSQLINSNIEVKSLHKRFHGGKDLFFKFKKNGEFFDEHSVRLYDFNLNIFNEIKNINYSIFPATYRDSRNGLFSHNILEITI